MLDWIPLDLILDGAVRHGSDRLPYYYGLTLIYSYSFFKWEKQKYLGRERDIKDKIQDIRQLIDASNNNLYMPEFIKSSNYTKGRFLQKPSLIVVHSMAGNMEPSIRHFQNIKSEVSAHYLVGHNGRVVQMVDEVNTAWHAGNFTANIRSIGIEHEGGEFPDGHNEHLQEEGYKASAQLIATIHKARGWGEPSSSTVKPHKEIKATKCPSGIDMGRLIQMAQDEYNGRVNVPVVELDVAGASLTITSPSPFNTNLVPAPGYREEVKRVHLFLISKGFLSLSPNELGYYGKKTQKAIDTFQKANGIPNASKYGWWYPATRAKANQLLNV